MGIKLNKISGRLTDTDKKFLSEKWNNFNQVQNDETYTELVVSFQKIAFRNFRHKLCNLLDNADESAIVMNLQLPFDKIELKYVLMNNETVDSILEMFQRVTIDSGKLEVKKAFNDDEEINNTLNALNVNHLIVNNNHNFFI